MRDRNPKPDSPESEVPRRHRLENRATETGTAFRKTLFLLALTLFMVLAGALLLETVATSLGIKTLEDSGAMAPGVSPGWGGLFQAYRYAISIFSILFAYHCFVWRDWARIGLSTVIVLDLVVWLIVSGHTFYTTGAFVLDIPRMFLQVFTVCFEVGLLMLLSDGQIKREFQRDQDRGGPKKNERAHGNL